MGNIVCLIVSILCLQYQDERNAMEDFHVIVSKPQYFHKFSRGAS